MEVTEEEQEEIRNMKGKVLIEKMGRESIQPRDFPAPYETIFEALKDLLANFKITNLSETNLKRKPIQEVSLSGTPNKQIKTSTGPIQKIYLQNENQISQETIIDSSKMEEIEEAEVKRTTIKETGVSGEAQLVSRDQVSKESGEATSGKGLQSTPKLSTKKKHKTRNAPSDKRRKINHQQKF